MTERLLQFIWQFQYFNRAHLQTISGEPITIQFPGQLNKEQGPDFLQARIRIGDTILAGSVELHIRTSGWDRHGHSQDPNYSNVILHAVYEHDAASIDLPVLELQPRISALLLDHYFQLMRSDGFIPCASRLRQVAPITWTSWKDRLVAERLQRKADHIRGMVKANQLDWEEGCWHLLARSFGTRTNGDAFEAIARSVSHKIMARHAHSIHQLEALLLGQGRLLGASFEEDYPRLLKREYQFLQQKLGLTPISMPVHFLRMRPQNFPTIRLAQLASLIQKSPQLFAFFLEANSVQQLSEWLQVTANDYWHYHYRFEETASFLPKKIGTDMVHHILINVAAPLLYAYGAYHRNQKFTDKAIDLLQQLPPENNKVIKGFKALGIDAANASDTQALLELHKNYCMERRCLDCAAGNHLLKKGMTVT